MANTGNTLYGLSTCKHCQTTRKILSDNNIEYNYIQVDDLEGEERKSTLADIRKINPRCSFPTIKINGIVIIGYKEYAIRKALGIKRENEH